MKRLALLLILCAIPLAARSDESDGTLQFYTGKSELVTVGTIVSVQTLGITEEGVQPYSCKVKVSQVLKGAPALAQSGQTINVYAERFESKPSDRLSILKAGKECVFFLAPSERSDTPYFNTVDIWFGIQQFNSQMARRIKELSKQKK